MQGPELMNKYVGESERAVREVRTLSLKWNPSGEPHICPLDGFHFVLGYRF